MKTILELIMLGFILTVASSCEKDLPKFKIKGRVMDGTTGFKYKQLIFDVHTKGGTNDKLIDKIGSFTTNDSGDFEFIYDKIKGTSARSLSLINSFIKFEGILFNQDVEKVFFKSTLGKYMIVCDCPKIKLTDTLFIEYGKMINTDIKRAVDTILNVKSGDRFFYSTWPRASISLAWGVNSSTFQSELYQNDLIITKFIGKLRGSVTGDPVIDEYKINF